MYPGKMENFHFPMFNSKFKLFKKKWHDSVTTKKIRVWNNKRYILRNEETIVYKRDNENQNF